MNIYDLIIVQPILNALLAIYSVVPGADFGLAIIIFTIIIRFMLYPLVKKQLHQSTTMRKLQPQLQKIKKDNKGNKQLEAVQMMDLYKRHGVSPFRSIGILLIQLPIFIGLYHAIQIFASDRGRIVDYVYSFVQPLKPVTEIINNPEVFNHVVLGFIDITKSAISAQGIDIALFCLALLAGVTQFVLAKQTMPQSNSNKTLRQIMGEAADGKQADQTEMNALVMQNMIKIMPVFMFIIMLNLPGALALYYVVSNLVAVGQQHFLLHKDEEELEELAEEPTKKPKKAAKTKQTTGANAKATQSAAVAATTTKSPKKASSKKTKPAASAQPAKKSTTPKGANITRITASNSKSKKARKAKK